MGEATVAIGAQGAIVAGGVVLAGVYEGVVGQRRDGVVETMLVAAARQAGHLVQSTQRGNLLLLGSIQLLIIIVLVGGRE